MSNIRIFHLILFSISLYLTEPNVGDNIVKIMYRTLPYNATPLISRCHRLDPNHSVVTGFQCTRIWKNQTFFWVKIMLYFNAHKFLLLILTTSFQRHLQHYRIQRIFSIKRVIHRIFQDRSGNHIKILKWTKTCCKTKLTCRRHKGVK